MIAVQNKRRMWKRDLYLSLLFWFVWNDDVSIYERSNTFANLFRSWAGEGGRGQKREEMVWIVSNICFWYVLMQPGGLARTPPVTRTFPVFKMLFRNPFDTHALRSISDARPIEIVFTRLMYTFFLFQSCEPILNHWKNKKKTITYFFRLYITRQNAIRKLKNCISYRRPSSSFAFNFNKRTPDQKHKMLFICSLSKLMKKRWSWNSSEMMISMPLELPVALFR